MKIKIIVAVIAVQLILLAFWLWPYSDNFTKEYQGVADQIVDIIEKDPTSEGMKNARLHFQSHESRLKDQFKFGLKADKNGAVSDKVRNRYQEVVNDASRRLSLLADKHPDLEREIKFLSADMGMQRLGY
ncbi:MAG TPA: hypothetical protein VJL58_07545 [Pyrinomonadaceae bacterium]|nr:hypothetical protein [Pyrinomonadaceae bacterium]